MADRYLLESSAVDGYLLEDASGVLLNEQNVADPPGLFLNANGHARANTLSLVGVIGSALVWGSLALFAPAQPTAQAAQYGYGTSNTAQASQSPGGVWGQRTALTPPASVPSTRISAAPQVDPYQIQPIIFKPQPAGLLLGKTLRAFPQVDPFQIQPELFSVPIAGLHVGRTLTAFEQVNPYQIQPDIFAQQPAGLHLGKTIIATAQVGPWQTQPLIFKQAPAAAVIAAPQPFGWVMLASPQVDPAQIQPELLTYPHAGVVVASPPPRTIITASPQIAERQLRGFVQVYGHVGAWLNYMEFVSGLQQVNPTQPTTKLFSYPHAAAVVSVPPARPIISASPQASPAQVQPEIIAYPHAGVVVAGVPSRIILARSHDAPAHVQPSIFRHAPAGVVTAAQPFGMLLRASPQGDQTQTQPEIFGQIPAGLHLGKTFTAFPSEIRPSTRAFIATYPHAGAVLVSPPLRPIIYARGYGAQEYEQPAPVIHAGGLAPFATAPIQNIVIVRLHVSPVNSREMSVATQVEHDLTVHTRTDRPLSI